MITAVTEGIRISVEARYDSVHSFTQGAHHLFAYFITIENKNDFDVQLLDRHWNIFDAIGLYSEVEGEGVVGMQPVIPAGKRYSYNSACNLFSGIGKMDGHYGMKRIDTSERFEVKIPEFQLEASFMLN